jgi:superfamily II DNA helicase RecQ
MAMKAHERLIVVLPTGGGKSLLFMLPAILKERDDGTTVVVVPFAALIQDVVRRARECGVDCIRWQSALTVGRDGPERRARLVVVSADLVEVGEFVQYLDHLRRLGVLKEIFVDESHTLVLDVNYRDRLLRLVGLHYYDCAIIFLTATLPGFVERRLRQTMLIEEAAIIRASTVKGNIRYQVQEIRKVRDVADAVEEMVERLGARMTRDQKGVVYCRTHTEAETMAERLGCDFYHSGIGEAHRRQEILERWMEGVSGQRWIVATTGLGTGIDIAGIVAVIHMGQPYGLVDFVQQTGRGGRRDGEVVDSVIIKGPGRAAIRAQASDVEHWNHEAMVTFIEQTSCRRTILGEIMDGRGRSCDELEVEACDRCRSEVEEVDVSGEEQDEREDEGYQTEIVSGSQRLKKHIQGTHQALDRLRGWLEEVKDYCPVCWVKWHRRGGQERHRKLVEHRIQECRVVRYEAFRTWRQGLAFGQYDCCWRCGLAGGWCDGAQRGLECEHADTVLPVMMEVVESEKAREWIREGLEVEEEVLLEQRGYLSWLGRRRQVYGRWMTNGMAVVATVVEQCDRQREERRRE